MPPEMTELECCPQCAAGVAEALDAAGLDCATQGAGECPEDRA